MIRTWWCFVKIFQIVVLIELDDELLVPPTTRQVSNTASTMSVLPKTLQHYTVHLFQNSLFSLYFHNNFNKTKTIWFITKMSIILPFLNLFMQTRTSLFILLRRTHLKLYFRTITKFNQCLINIWLFRNKLCPAWRISWG